MATESKDKLPCPMTHKKRENNKRIVTEFYKAALFEGDVDKSIRLYDRRTDRVFPHSVSPPDKAST
jgi:hypothetical protein